jgi:hypothetical protein
MRAAHDLAWHCHTTRFEVPAALVRIGPEVADRPDFEPIDYIPGCTEQEPEPGALLAQFLLGHKDDPCQNFFVPAVAHPSFVVED